MNSTDISRFSRPTDARYVSGSSTSWGLLWNAGILQESSRNFVVHRKNEKRRKQENFLHSPKRIKSKSVIA
jgi:hypothetical protein